MADFLQLLESLDLFFLMFFETIYSNLTVVGVGVDIAGH